MTWQRVDPGNKWSERYGYSRVIRVGDLVFVNGTAPIGDDGATFAPHDAGAQAIRCLEMIEHALGELGLTRTAIVRSTFFVTDISRQDEFGLAHRAFFGDHRPCLTLVGIKELVSPDMLVEIACDAVAVE